MEKQSLTALVSAFARAYHSKHKRVKVFEDPLARLLISDEEYAGISGNMAKAAAFFRPGFSGSPDEALREVVDHQLSPTPLGRAAFTEEALEAAVRLGARQYLIFAAGYDTFAYRQPVWAAPLQIFEIDHPATAADKHRRISALPIAMPANLHFITADFHEQDWRSRVLDCPAFDPSRISFCSLLGISYYLTKEVFLQLLTSISSMLPRGSSIVFDYPDELTFTEQAGERAKKQVMMAAQAGEPMGASYSYPELEGMLEEADLLIYKHLTPEEITNQLFQAYNASQPDHPMTAFDHVHYVLAVKQ